VPAAAVIPAPIAYTNVVAVKKLVVGSGTRDCRLDRALMPGSNPGAVGTISCTRSWFYTHGIRFPCLKATFIGGWKAIIWGVRGCHREQNSVFKAGAAMPFCLHDRAWNDKGATMELIFSLFVGFDDTNGKLKAGAPCGGHSSDSLPCFVPFCLSLAPSRAGGGWEWIRDGVVCNGV